MKPYSKILKIAVLASMMMLATEKIKGQESTPTGNSNISNSSVNYVNGLGIRSGSDFGLTYKHFIRSNAALEGIVSTGYKAFDFTLLYEWHLNAFHTPGMFFFYGAGGHAGFWERRINVHYDPYYYYYTSYSYPSFGIAGIVGLEYKIPPIPFTVGVDLKPVIDIYYPGYAFLEGALSVRYVFKNPD
jgi:hypothetical protein